jgi:hypothetical protein
MSQTIYNTYSRFFGYASECDRWIYRMSANSYSKRFKIPIYIAKVIKSVNEHPTLSRSFVIGTLFALAKHIENFDFWYNFQPKIEYIYIECARIQFFPLIEQSHLELLRHMYEKQLGIVCNVDKLFYMFRVKMPEAQAAMNYIRIRSRCTPRRLANLFIAAHILPHGLFDWNSCFCGDERENLMMFGIEEFNQETFDKWSDLWLEFSDVM